MSPTVPHKFFCSRPPELCVICCLIMTACFLLIKSKKPAVWTAVSCLANLLHNFCLSQVWCQCNKSSAKYTSLKWCPNWTAIGYNLQFSHMVKPCLLKNTWQTSHTLDLTSLWLSDPFLSSLKPVQSKNLHYQFYNSSSYWENFASLYLLGIFAMCENILLVTNEVVLLAFEG